MFPSHHCLPFPSPFAFLAVFLLLVFLPATQQADISTLLAETSLSDFSTVVLPPGLHSVSTPISIRDFQNLTVQGSGSGIEWVDSDSSDELTIIECADFEIFEKRKVWTEHDSGKYYSTSWTFHSCSENKVWGAIGPAPTADPAFHLSAQRRQLWTYDTLNDLVDDLTFLMTPGLFYDVSGETLYIRLEVPGMSPNELPEDLRLFVSCERCFDIDSVRGMRLSGFVLDGGGDANFRGDDCDGVVLSNVVFSGSMEGVVFKTSRNVVIEDCIVRGNIAREWYWQDYKDNDVLMEQDGIKMKNNFEGIVVQRNDVSGFFNGISVVSDVPPDDPPNGCSNGAIVAYNVIHDISDDALEIEGCNMGTQIYRNLVYNTYTAISFAPTIGGPVYVYQNLFIADREMSYNREDTPVMSGKVFKGESGFSYSMEKLKVYHNTAIAKWGRVIAGRSDEEYSFKNCEWYNNIVYQIYSSNDDHYQKWMSYSGLESDGNRFDGNCYWSDKPEEGVESYFKYCNTFSDDTLYYHLSDLLAGTALGTGWEEHGMEANPRLEFTPNTVPMTEGECPIGLSLGPESPVVGAGVLDVLSTFPLDDVLSEAIESGSVDIGCMNFFQDHPLFSSGSPSQVAIIVGVSVGVSVLAIVILISVVIVIIVCVLRSRKSAEMNERSEMKTFQ